MDHRSLFSSWRNDLPSSIVVFLVALPLCLGIALASGAPLISGVIAGTVGGLVVGLVSGSPLGVSGPAAGLTAIVLAASSDLGGYGPLLMAVILAGVLQILLGYLKAGVIAYYFPNSVIHGMLAGIGMLIILTQLTHAVGFDAEPESDETFHYTALSRMLDPITPGAVVITVSCLVLLWTWQRPAVQRIRVLGFIPGSMLAVVLGVVLAAVFDGIPALALGSEHFADLPNVDGINDLPRPEWSAITDARVWKTAVVIALVASLETLLCVEATDKLDPLKRATPANRELHAQGLGNLVSGLLGGLPVTQVIVRSSANIHSGGRNKLSAILHGAFILVAVLAFPGLLNEVPLASLAAVLFIVGYKLIKPEQFKEMWHQGVMRFLPFTLTALGVAFIDLLTGVGLGMAVAVIHILWKNYRVPFHFDRDAHRHGEPILIELSEDVTFLNKAGIKRTLGELPDGSRVVIDASRTMDLDPDVEEIIAEFRADAPGRHIEVECTGFGKHRQQNTKVLFRQVILTAARSFASGKN
jgi:MFS superfamily sulfate permease-like transporter